MAPTNDIIARLRLLDTLRFRKNAKEAANAIKGIKRAAKDSDGPLSQLGGALGELSQALPNLTGRTRIFGFAIGTVITAFIAVIPLVVGLGGAVVALTGSLAAAALGAGLLGTAVAGALLPFGAFALVAGQAISGFKKVNTAFQAYNVAVGAYGKNSTQAETALKRLHGYIKNNGGPIVFRAVLAWNHFTNAFRKANSPAVRVIMQVLISFFHAAQKLMPAFSKMTYEVARALQDSLTPALAGIGDGKSTFKTLTDAFTVLAGPVIRSAVNLIAGFFSIATRLAGEVGPMAGGIERITGAFRDWAAHGNLAPLVNQFKEWFGLLKAVGGLLVTVLSKGAGSGRDLVASLTGVVNKWNEWLKAHPDSVTKFFGDAFRMTVAFARIFAGVVAALFKFGRMLLPTYTKVFKALSSGWHQFVKAIEPAAPFFKNILGPLLKGFAEGVIGGVVGAFKLLIFVVKIVANILGFLGNKLSFLKPIMQTVGQVIGFFAGPAILGKIGTVLKWISPLFGPVTKAIELMILPIRLAGKFVGWLLGKLAGMGSWIASHAAGIFKPIEDAGAAILHWLTGAGSKFYNAGAKIWKFMKNGLMNAIGSGLGFAGDIAKSIANSVIHLLNSAIPNKIPIPGAPDINLPNNPIPMLAAGGVVSGSGSWITGEAGPEINTLLNGKVQVVPLSPSVSAQSANATLAPREGTVHVSKVYLRGKQIAEAVAGEAADERARR